MDRRGASEGRLLDTAPREASVRWFARARGWDWMIRCDRACLRFGKYPRFSMYHVIPGRVAEAVRRNINKGCTCRFD